MWTTSIRMPETDERTQDSSGFVTHSVQYAENIPASRLDTTRSDELQAYQMGKRADVIFEVDAAVYTGAGYLIDEATGEQFDIIRTFQKERSNRIRLTGQRREHGGI